MLSISIFDEKVSKYESFPLAATIATESIVKAIETKNSTIVKPFEREPEFLTAITAGSQVLEES